MESLPLSAAELTLDLKMRVGVSAESGTTDKGRHIAVFILDRSQSMKKDYRGKKGFSRDQELKNRLNARIAQLENNTEVYYFAFASTVRPFLTPHVATDAKSREKLFEEMAGLSLETFTLLYDAQAQALDFVRRELQRDPQARAEVYLYTDGDHQTDHCESAYPAEYYKNKRNRRGQWVHQTDVWGDKVENDGYLADKEKMFRLFQSQYAELRKNQRLTMVQEYLGDGNTPDTSKWSLDPVYALRASLADQVLYQNANSAVGCTIQIPLPRKEEQWKFLEGREVLLRLSCDGKRIMDRPVKFVESEKAQQVKFTIPDFTQKADAVVEFEFLEMPELPKEASFKLQAPKPLSLVFRPKNKLRLEVAQPGKRKIVSAGSAEPIAFSIADVTPGADVAWTFAGRSGTGATWNQPVPKKAGLYPYSVRATKGDDALPAEDKGVVEVIDTGVSLTGTTQAKTGEPASFTAKGEGPVVRYEWLVDGKPVPGVSKTLVHVFSQAAAHKVQVKAVYSAVPAVLSEQLDVSVRKAPFVEIVTPANGDGFSDTDEIPLQAKVEGTFSKVVWSFKGRKTSFAVTNDVGTVGKACIDQGGAYEVTARALGGADGSLAAESVKIRVKLTHLRIDVLDPSGRLETGKPFVCKAKVGNKAITGLKWNLRCAGKNYHLGDCAVENGIGMLEDAKLPASVGDGCGQLTAAAVFANPDPEQPPVVSDPVEIDVYTYAELKVVSHTLSDGGTKSNIAYGELIRLSGARQQVGFTAQAQGALQGCEITWYMDDGSGPKRIGGGTECVCDVPAVKIFTEREQLPVDYWAVGKLPNGKTKSTQKFTVGYICCSDSICSIAATDASGRAKTVSDLGETIAFELKTNLSGNRFAQVEWDFGDGVKKTGGTAVSHSYAQESPDGGFKVSAVAWCARCTRRHVVKEGPGDIVVKAAPLFAVLEANPKTCKRSESVVLSAKKSTGNISDYMWATNGIVNGTNGVIELKEFRGQNQVKIVTPASPKDLKVILTVYGPKIAGKVASATDEETVKVRYGWWAALPPALVLLFLLYIAYRLLLGNEPKKWDFYSWEGPAPKLIGGSYPNELGDAYLTKGVPLSGIRHWNYWTKKGRISVNDMLGLEMNESSPWNFVSADEFIVSRSGGTPMVKGLDGKYCDITASVDPTGEAPFYLFEYIGVDNADEIRDGHGYLRLRVVTNDSSGIGGLVAFVVVAGLLLWGFTWFCLVYAV